MITEKEAWLKLAEMFEPGRELPMVQDGSYYGPVTGICIGTLCLRNRGLIDGVGEEEMDDRLERYFRPLKTYSGYYWPCGSLSRAARATACGFLAVMCEEQEAGDLDLPLGFGRD